jgi:hypothetical protein
MPARRKTARNHYSIKATCRSSRSEAQEYDPSLSKRAPIRDRIRLDIRQRNILVEFCLGVQFDEIGIWSEVKLAIIKEYASAYATIMEA